MLVMLTAEEHTEHLTRVTVNTTNRCRFTSHLHAVLPLSQTAVIEFCISQVHSTCIDPIMTATVTH